MNKVVEQLRKARDLMNHGGKHWIKGAAKARILPSEHQPGDSPPVFGSQAPKESEYAFCSIGALTEVKAGRLAQIELAKAIDPVYTKSIEEEVIDECRFEHEWLVEEWENDDPKSRGPHPGKFVVDDDIRATIEKRISDHAEGIIINFNDDSNTTWADVRSAFTKAARRVSQRKG